PICADGYTWWQVQYRGVIAWTAESDNEDYWLEPIVIATPVVSEDTCIVVSDGIANMRKGPGTSYDPLGQLSPGQSFPVIGQAQGSTGFTWYKMNNGAWVREDAVRLEGNCNAIPEADR
ncbi:MAG: SH3 domain-containing protein, partial [Anaerolineae bacterium]|nr:SH3 domain-containing protein [Anaerolineae bacterium]